MCWRRTDPKSRSSFPRCSSLHVALTRKHHPPTKAASSLCVIWLKHLRSSEGWQKAGKKEDVSLQHIKGVALFTCVGLLLHGRQGTETTSSPMKNTENLFFIHNEQLLSHCLLKCVINVHRVCLYLGLFICFPGVCISFYSPCILWRFE